MQRMRSVILPKTARPLLARFYGRFHRCSTSAAAARLANLWDDEKASALSEPERLVYRSNMLGSDKRVTNYGGGNTSSKIWQKDPLTGEEVEVLWVKGSGGDSASIKLDGFATLYMDKLSALKGLYRGVEHEDEMVGYLPHCTFNLNPRAASIDTPLHAYVPQRPCRPHASRRHHRDRRGEEFEGADQGNLRRRDRLAAVEAAGLRARPVAGEILPGEPGRQGRRSWKATACSPGATRRRNATRPRSRSSTRRSTGSSSKSAGKAIFGGAAVQVAGASGAARHRGAG